MIVRLNKEQQKLARRQALKDIVYILCQDALKQMQIDGNTELSPIEVFVSARNFCETVLALPDIEEGLAYEIEDLEEEAEGGNDAMLIMSVAATQMQAMSNRRVGIDFRSIIYRIFEHLDDNKLFPSLIMQMTDKEDARWLEGKKTDLLNYELKEIELEGGGSEDVRQLFEDFVFFSDKTDSQGIKEAISFLNWYNNCHGHKYDDIISNLYEKLGIKSKTILDIKEYNAVKHVETQIQNVESGGTGVKKEYHKN